MSLIFTTGHSNCHWAQFTYLLEDNKIITAITDVRRYPRSRACPQFNKENTIRELLMKNIEYRHIVNLGGRQKQTDQISEDDSIAAGKTSLLDSTQTIW